MKKVNLYASILKKLSSQEEQNIMSLSFLNEIMYYTTRISDTDIFINKVVDVISKYLGASAVYLINDINQYIVLKYATIKDIPEKIKLKKYNKFINTLARKGSPELNIKQMESSEDIAECVSFHKKFSILPLVVRNVKLPLGIIVIDIDLNKVKLTKLQTLNTAIVLISNSISYSNLVKQNRWTAKNILKLILKIMRFGDLSTYRHSLRVKRYAMEIGKMLSLSSQEMQRLHLSSLLHDIGKIAIPYEVLHKEKQLSDKEFELIKQHVNIGYSLLKEFNFFKESLPDILGHHEKLDGSGYPNKITEIDTVTQVLAVADIIDAIASTRSYKEDKGFSYITDELAKLQGKYDNKIVQAAIDFINSNKFLTLKKRLKKIELEEKEEPAVSISNLQEKVNQLKSENQNLSKQIELFKKLLSKSQKTIEEMMQTSRSTNENYSIYKNITKLISDTIKPISMVFVKIYDNSLSIERVKGKPVNLEDSIRLLSSKKVFQSISSKNIYISKNLIAFPLFKEEAVCAFLSKESSIDETAIKQIEEAIKNTIKQGSKT